MNIGKDLVAASATPLILAILSEGESYGYAIIKRVAELSGGELQWTDGMLYPVLHRLERNGFVKAVWGQSESGRQRKYYRLTESGEGGAGEPAATVAGGGLHAAADAVPLVPTGASRRLTRDAGNRPPQGRDAHIAGRRYRGVALVPPATAGDPLRGRGRAGGPPSQPGERARARRGSRRTRRSSSP